MRNAEYKIGAMFRATTSKHTVTKGTLYKVTKIYWPTVLDYEHHTYELAQCTPSGRLTNVRTEIFGLSMDLNLCNGLFVPAC